MRLTSRRVLRAALGVVRSLKIARVLPSEAVIEAFEPRQLLASVTYGEFQYLASRQRIEFGFDADVSTTIDISDFLLQDLTDGTNITSSFDGSPSSTAGFQFTTGTSPEGRLKSGEYSATILGGSTGRPISADHELNFFFLDADFNRDRVVNFDDLLIQAQNYGDGQSGKTFAQGDATYDGIVNFDDLLILAQNYSISLPEPSSSFADLKASATGDDAIRLSWRNLPSGTDWTHLRVYRSANGTDFDQIHSITYAEWAASPFASLDSTSWTDSGLDDGSKYWYRVRAWNANTNTFAATSNKKWAVTVLPAPTNPHITGISGDEKSLTFAWDAQSLHHTGFTIEVQNASGTQTIEVGSPTQLSKYFENLPVNEATSFRVRAKNQHNVSAPTEWKTYYPSGSAPTSLNGTRSGTGVLLSWQSSGLGVDYFVIQRRAYGTGDYVTKGQVQGTLASWLDTNGLVEGQEYQYRVRAVRNSSWSEPSNIAVVNAPLANAHILSLNLDDTTVAIEWSDESDINTAYKVERRIANGGLWTTLTSTLAGNATDYVDESPLAGEVLEYRVTATNATSASTGANQRIIIPPSVPAGLSAEANNYSSIEISWDDVIDHSGTFKGYLLQRRKASSTDWEPVFGRPILQRTYIDTNREADTHYEYQVKSVNGGGSSSWSGSAGATTAYIPSSAPNLSLKNDVSHAYVKWTQVNGAQGYELLRVAPSISESKTYNLDASIDEFNDSDAADGTHYIYRVRVEGATNWSEPVEVLTIPRSLDDMSAGPHGGNTISVRWTEIERNGSGDIQIQLQRRVSDPVAHPEDGWSDISMSVDDAKADMPSGYLETGVANDEAIEFRVRTYCEAVIDGDLVRHETPWLSGAASVDLQMPIPPQQVAMQSLSDSAIAVTWRDVEGEEDYYQVYVSNDGATFKPVARTNPDATSAAIRGLNPNVRYYARVTRFVDGEESDFGSNSAIATFFLPQNLGGGSGQEASDGEGEGANSGPEGGPGQRDDYQGEDKTDAKSQKMRVRITGSGHNGEFGSGLGAYDTLVSYKDDWVEASSVKDGLYTLVTSATVTFANSPEDAEDGLGITAKYKGTPYYLTGAELYPFPEGYPNLPVQASDLEGRFHFYLTYETMGASQNQCKCGESAGTSSNPVRYADGAIRLQSNDLASDLLGSAWGHSREWTNSPNVADQSPNGKGFVNESYPYLIPHDYGSMVGMVTNGMNVTHFDRQINLERSDGTPNWVKVTADTVPSDEALWIDQDLYNPASDGLNSRWSGDGATISHDSAAHEYRVTDVSGDQMRFHDFTIAAHLRGKLIEWIKGDGEVITIASADVNAQGNPTRIQRSHVSSTNIKEFLDYTYFAGNTIAAINGKIQTATLRRKIGTAPEYAIRSVEYTYYGNSGQGQAGQLKLAVVKNPNGTAVKSEYYRYYSSGQLKMYFDDEALARLRAEFGNEESAPDVSLNPNSKDALRFSSNYFEYDDSGRVVKEIASKAGCSCSSGGAGTFTFDYDKIENGVDVNDAVMLTTETLPDGSQNIVHTNSAGKVLLHEFRDTEGRSWFTYNKYNNAGQLTSTASPSAVAGSTAGLAPNIAASVNVRDDAGVITTYAYTADGNIQDVSIQRGELGEPIRQSSRTYGTLNVDDRHSEYLLSETVYENEDGTGSRTTSYSTTWYPTTFQPSVVQVFERSVSVGENGSGYTNQQDSGDPYASTVKFDAFGRIMWSKDADGYISYNKYDPATGQVVLSISDVSISKLSQNLTTAERNTMPSGWTTPAAAAGRPIAGGTHVVTTATYDWLGRPLSVVKPALSAAASPVDARTIQTQYRYNDDRREVRVYQGIDEENETVVAPVKLYRQVLPTSGAFDLEKSVFYESLTYDIDWDTFDFYDINGSDTVDENNIRSLTRQVTNDTGQLEHIDQYFNFSGLNFDLSNNSAIVPLVGLGVAQESKNSATGHYHQTLLGYNERGVQARTVDPTGTITTVVYDQLNRPTSVWVGTNDSGGTHSDPSGSWQDPANNMTQVSRYAYDAPPGYSGSLEGGDGNLTFVEEYNGEGADFTPIQTQLVYDWRNRLVTTKQGTWGTENADFDRPLTFIEYNNLDQPVSTYMYDGDNVPLDDVGVALQRDNPALIGKLRAQSSIRYDVLSRPYRQTTYAVNQTTGDIEGSLTSDVWYDRRSNVVKTDQPGGLVSKVQYDGLGRPVYQSTSDGGGDVSWADAFTVTDDTVLSQAHSFYDRIGNVYALESRERFHNATGTGALGSPSVGVGARVNYQVYQYDVANRLLASADLGSNGGSVLDTSALKTLVAGHFPTRSAISLVTSYDYDDAGNAYEVTDPKGIKTHYDFDALSRVVRSTEAFSGSGIPTANTNRRTDYTYNGRGNVLTMSAVTQADAGGSPTKFQTTQYVYGTTKGAAMISGNGWGQNQLSSNALLAAVKYPTLSGPNEGQPDSNQMERFAYNMQGQVAYSQDRNGTMHAYGYDQLGRLHVDDIHDHPSTVDFFVHKLEYNYTILGALESATSYGQDDGIVNQVTRSYNGLGQLTDEFQSHDGAVDFDGSDSDVRIGYQYSYMEDGANHSRPTGIVYPDFKTVTYRYSTGINNSVSRLSSIGDLDDTYESYKYLGLGTIVERYRPEPNFALSYIKAAGEANGEAGDQYIGLDRFGRVAEQRWISDNSTRIDDLTYTYDFNSNRTSRSNELLFGHDEVYSYDNLNRLSSFGRGTAEPAGTGLVGAANRSQSWNLDPLGNWNSVTTDGTSASRTHNGQNQISGTGFAYSNAGEMTAARFNLPDGGGQVDQKYKYDTWGRLVAMDIDGNGLFEDDGDILYEYDALNRRIQETIQDGTAQWQGDVEGSTRDFYYSANWQVLEERTRDDDEPEYEAQPAAQYVWGPQYVDQLILIDREVDGNPLTPLEDRMYVQQDANFNVTSVTNENGTLLERYEYDPYGQRLILDADWSADANQLSDVGMLYGFQGGRHTESTANVHFRNRDLNVVLGRWNRQDPAGFINGANVYQAFNSNAYSYIDPTGLWGWNWGGVISNPSHESITTMGVEQAGYPTWFNDDYLKALQEGNISVDAPHGKNHMLTFYANTKGARDRHLVDTDEAAAYWRSTDFFDEYETQMGRKTYQHAMSSGRYNCKELVDKMVGDIMAHFDTAVDKYRNGHRMEAIRSLGKALHTIQDSYAPAHTNRQYTGSWTIPMGAIQRFQDYSKQDQGKHEKGDDRYRISNGFHVTSAIYQSAMFMRFAFLTFDHVDRRSLFVDQDRGALEDYLRNSVFKLAEGCKAGGTDPEFAK